MSGISNSPGSPGIALLGVPLEIGASQRGTLMGPDALRTAGIGRVLEQLGFDVEDHGNLSAPTASPADDPPPAAVARVAGAFLASEGDLPSVYRALTEAREAWAEPLTKYKTPNDFIVSAYRGLSLPVEPGSGALASLEVLGQRTGGARQS